ncbi:MAG: hypothetical protein ABI065_01045 [Terrimesophilobacter sp.]
MSPVSLSKSSSGSGRHVLPSRRRRTGVLPGVLKTLAGVSSAVLIALLATGGTYALWNGEATVPGGTMRAGAASFAVTPIPGQALPTTALYPGLTIYGGYTATNTGDVPLALSVQSLSGSASPTAFSSALSIAVGAVGTPAECTAGFPVGWTGGFASPAGTLGLVLAAGQSTTLCLSVTLPVTAANGIQGSAAPDFRVVIGGVQP